MNKDSNLPKFNLTDKDVVSFIPEWAGQTIEVSILKGGITNLIYRAKCAKGDVAIRIYGDNTEMFIDRDREASALKQMSDAKITANLIKYAPKKKATIVEYITGAYTLKNEDFLKDELRELIVKPIREIHTSGATLDYIFNPYEQCIKMYHILNDLNVAFPKFDIPGTLKYLKILIEKINIPESKYVITHNDLLADNFILVTDEYKHKFEKPIYIIDWEYAGMGPKYYDIADLFQEVLVPREVELKITEHYCEGKNFNETLYYIDMFKPFPDIYWTLWSLIQKTVSKIDFDFYEYGRVKYENARNNIKFLESEYGIKF
ncbi:MAG: hypothetical protein DRJ10_17845 [Bacteroidetes bacterium]|nr:MAG: hypothetical protein DRJ10_17845 [Bacteroidota bacterium]